MPVAPVPAAPGEEQPTGVRWLVLALGSLVSFTLYLHRYTWGFLKNDLREEFGWDLVTLGWLDSAFSISYGIGQVPAGMLSDWFGARGLMVAAIAGWSLSLGATALATGVVSMAAFRLLFGATQAGCYPTLSKVTKNWFPIGSRTGAQAWMATFAGRMGGAMSTVLLGTVLMGWLHLPWRGAIAVLTGIGLTVGVVFLLLFRNSPAAHPRANSAEAELIAGTDPAARQASRARVSWSKLLKHPTVLLLMARCFLSTFADQLFVSWIPLYLLMEKQVDVKEAGWMTSIPLIGGALGGVFSGYAQSWILLRTGRARLARSTLGFCGKFTAMFVIYISLLQDNPLLIVLLLGLTKFFADWGLPASWGAVTDIGGRSPASVFGSINTVGSIGGALAGPVIGWVILSFSSGDTPDGAGWTALFVLVGVVYVTCASLWLLIDCTNSIEPEDAPPPATATT